MSVVRGAGRPPLTRARVLPRRPGTVGQWPGAAATTRRGADIDLRLIVGLVAVASSTIYFVSDLIEVAEGNFSTPRLALTYAGEAAIPLFVLGLYALQRPSIGRLGLLGALAYAYAYVFFTGTVLHAIVAGTPDWPALTTTFGAWMTVHGAILVVGGVAFGLAVVRSRVLPRWTGIALMVGVVLVAAASGLANLPRTIAAAVPDAAFIGMGVAVLRARSDRAVASSDGITADEVH